jgi:tetratricopeptide (TPR) repeat protein
MLLLLLFPALARAETHNTYLERGIRYYEYGDYDNSIKALLQVQNISGTSASNADVHLYLALDYYAKGMNEAMKKELEALYQTAPGFQMNPVIVPPAVVSAYSDVKKHAIVPLRLVRGPQDHNYWLRLVPFGVGQYSKGDDTNGTILLIAEAAELAVNISTYYNRKAHENHDGSYNNPVWANNMQAVQLTAFWLFAGTASYGIVDAFVWRMP